MTRLAFVLTFLQLGASAATFIQQLFIARVVGANEQTDGYQVALALVLFLAQSVIATALVNAFVPTLSAMSHENVDGSRAYAFWVQINVVLAASAVTLLLWIATPSVMSLTVARQLSPAAHIWAVESFRIMLLSVPLAALSGVYTSSSDAAGDLKFVAVAQVAQNGVAAAFALVAYSMIGFIALPLSLVVGAVTGSLTLLGRLYREIADSGPSSTISASLVSIIFRATAAPLVVPVLTAVPGFVNDFLCPSFLWARSRSLRMQGGYTAWRSRSACPSASSPLRGGATASVAVMEVRTVPERHTRPQARCYSFCFRQRSFSWSCPTS